MLTLLFGYAAVLLAPVHAQSDMHTVWGSVIYQRMGERTPDVLGTLPTLLTSTGAQEAYSAGQFFRQRYLTSSPGMYGMNENVLDPDQLYVLALDLQPSVASAQAFVQGLYPPYTINQSTISLEPSSLLANGTYVDAPLNGYQYPYMHVANAPDYDYTFIGGNLDCPGLTSSINTIENADQSQSILSKSQSVYQAISPLLQDITWQITAQEQNFGNAYAIYDYISYLAAHNETVAEILQSSKYQDPATGKSYLYTLQWLADEQQQLNLGDMSAYNGVTKSTTLPYTTGSISTIAGNMLAIKVLTQLSENIYYAGESIKLSLLFGDFEPLVSLFALMDLNNVPGSQFTGLPQYASSAVFELYSISNSSTPSFPDNDGLYVRFMFRNGTNDNTTFYSYPAFNRGPSETDMTWTDFEALMTQIALSGIGDWCTQCAATHLWCAAWNNAVATNVLSTSTTSTDGAQLSPVAAGAVGAVVALAVAGLLFALVMLFGRVRFHRRPKKGGNDAGGYKGSAKLASDQDLTLPKSGVVIGTKAEEEDDHDTMHGHERTGSWEMKDTEDGHKPARSKRASFEEEDDDDDDLKISPFSEPVKAHEAV